MTPHRLCGKIPRPCLPEAVDWNAEGGGASENSYTRETAPFLAAWRGRKDKHVSTRRQERGELLDGSPLYIFELKNRML